MGLVSTLGLKKTDQLEMKKNKKDLGGEKKVGFKARSF